MTVSEMPIWNVPLAWETHLITLPDFKSALTYPAGIEKWQGEIGHLDGYRVIVVGKKGKS